MLDLNKLRSIDPKILCIGSYPPIIQSILDFDHLTGRPEPSVTAVIGGRKKSERFFWGKGEILIPHYQHVSKLPEEFSKKLNLFLNVTSGRRVYDTTKLTLDFLPGILGGVIFAEDTPEMHALALFAEAEKRKKFIIGPASVGILVPGYLKLGAIGGIRPEQIASPTIINKGTTAVFSASGGMVNELINILVRNNIGISFALSFGGERFPILRPRDAFLAAENDPQTKDIIYFGEIGGYDEYEIADLINSKKIKKTVIAYIAGSVSEMFDDAPQFGHAKALVKYQKESAREKSFILKNAGVNVCNSFREFVNLLENLKPMAINTNIDLKGLNNRKKSLFTSSISEETDNDVKINGESLLDLSKGHTFSYIVCAVLLGKKKISPELEKFTDLVFKLMIDHGPQVSGAVNTIISARAGKDMASSLAAGILTVGNRFGGAINSASENWLKGVGSDIKPSTFVEEFASRGEYIEGIGHKKYSLNNPDPRVQELIRFAEGLKKMRYLNFAREVEKITSNKKSNLILNADGAIAAVLLDILAEKENFATDNLEELIEIEFFNAYFLLPRSIGFVGHYLDQKRLDEGLFRLPKEDILYLK